MPRLYKILFYGELLFSLCVFCACSGHGAGTSVGVQGDNQGFEGGDVLLTYLDVGRQSLLSTLAGLASSPSDPALCNVDDPTGIDPIVFSIAHAMTPAQRAYCQLFVQTTLTTLPSVYNAQGPTPFDLGYSPIWVTEGGTTFEVVAKTLPEMSAAIDFDGTILLSYSQQEVEATLAHEFGHKLNFTAYGGYVTDVDPAGPFATGREFLDSTGAGMAAYTAYMTATNRFATAMMPMAIAIVTTMNAKGTQRNARDIPINVPVIPTSAPGDLPKSAPGDIPKSAAGTRSNVPAIRPCVRFRPAP